MKKLTNRILAGALVAASMGVVHAQDAQSVWKGPVQFNFEKDANALKDARASAEVEITVAAAGITTGTISSGCKITGAVLQPSNPSSLSFDLALTDCQDKRFNGKYGGSLKITADRSASFTLSSVRPFRMEVAQIAGTVSR